MTNNAMPHYPGSQDDRWLEQPEKPAPNPHYDAVQYLSKPKTPVTSWSATTSMILGIATLNFIVLWVMITMIPVVVYFMFGAPTYVYGPIFDWSLRYGLLWPVVPIIATVVFSVVSGFQRKGGIPIGRFIVTWACLFSIGSFYIMAAVVARMIR